MDHGEREKLLKKRKEKARIDSIEARLKRLKELLDSRSEPV